MARIVAILALSVTLVSCSGPSGEPKPSAPSGSPHAVPTAEARPGGTIPVGAFNEYVAKEKPGWSESPLRSALEFVGLRRPDASFTRAVEIPGPEGSGPATVTIVRSGLGDDSVRALRYRLVFQSQPDGTWRLSSARWGQRCAPGRGHQRFSPELCV